MVRQQVYINNEKGLHARPATQFLKVCLQYESRISLGYGDEFVNAKSISSLLKLGIPGGSQVELVVEGADEQVALQGIADFLKDQLCD